MMLVQRTAERKRNFRHFQQNQLTKIDITWILQQLKVWVSLSAISLRCINFLFRILSFAFVLVMFTLCEILGSCVHKFVLHLKDVYIFIYYGNLSPGVITHRF